MIYIGIDPGKDGALAQIGPEGIAVVPYDPETYAHILTLAGSANGCVACLEHVGAMPGQGVTSMFSFGENFGFIQGLLTACGVPYQLVRPQRWKKEFGISGKNESIAVCKRLFPEVSLRRNARCKNDHDGMAEALLMAEYARRKF